MNREDRIFVAGHRGMVGSALVRRLRRAGYSNLILRSRQELDLENQEAVTRFFDAERPDLVFLAAAKVGGILANSRFPADFIRANLAIGLNVVSAASEAGVARLVNLGSSCIYPREGPQPLTEDSLLTGPLEPTNEPYAIAKIATLKLCEAFNQQFGTTYISVMPTNLYGPGDSFHPEHSHVIPGLIRRFHHAKADGEAEVIVWGTGTPRREFLHVDDLAEACVLLAAMEEPPELVNVGVGEDLSIAELAGLVAEAVGFDGDIVFDPTRPDGTPRKLMDIGRIRALGWEPSIDLSSGLKETYRWFRSHEG